MAAGPCSAVLLCCLSLSRTFCRAGAGGALLLPGTKAKPGKIPAEEPGPSEQEQPPSKSQLRKLKQVQQKKERRETIAQVGRQQGLAYWAAKIGSFPTL